MASLARQNHSVWQRSCDQEWLLACSSFSRTKRKHIQGSVPTTNLSLSVLFFFSVFVASSCFSVSHFLKGRSETIAPCIASLPSCQQHWTGCLLFRRLSQTGCCSLPQLCRLLVLGWPCSLVLLELSPSVLISYRKGAFAPPASLA